MTKNTSDKRYANEKLGTNLFWDATELLKRYVQNDDFHVAFFLATLMQKGYLGKKVVEDSNEILPSIEKAIREARNHKNETDISELLEIYLPILKNLPEDELHRLIEIFKRHLSYDNPSYDLVFETMLHLYNRMQQKYSGEHQIPFEIVELISSIIELPEDAKVYNPFAGVASFLIGLEEFGYCLAQETGRIPWAIGYMRLIAHSLELKVEWQQTDSLKVWGNEPIDWDDLYELFEKEMAGDFFKNKFDLVIFAPPLNTPIFPMGFGYMANTRSLECLSVYNAVNSLKPGGHAIAILPASFLSKGIGSELKMRKFLLVYDLIDTIIQLPQGLMGGTSQSLIILILSNNKSLKDQIRVVNASEFTIQVSKKQVILDHKALINTLNKGNQDHHIRLIGHRDLDGDYFDLSVKRFFIERISDTILFNVGEIIRGEKAAEGTIGKFVRIRNLNESFAEFQLDLHPIPEVEIPKSALRINESCVLVAARWKTFKPTWFEYSGTQIYIPSDIFAFKPDTSKCDKDYLITELQAEYVQRQIEKLAIGQVMPTIRRFDFLRIQIKLPALEIQRELVADRRRRLADEKKRELELFNRIHGLEEERQEQNRYLRHTLAGPASNLKSSVFSIKKILKNHVLLSVPELYKLKETEKDLYNLGDWLDILERDAVLITETVARQARVEDEIAAKELLPLDILSYLQNYVSERKSNPDKSFDILFDFDPVYRNENGETIATYILGNPQLLRGLLDNLIHNAIQHAFPGHRENRFEIYVMKNQDDTGGGEVSLLLSNTGNVFPDNITKEDYSRKGFSVGLTAGDGFGGWYINEVVKRFGGNWDIINEKGPEGLPGTDLATSFEIIFPIIETEEHEEL